VASYIDDVSLRATMEVGVFGKNKAERVAARERETVTWAAEYVLACILDDERRIDDAVMKLNVTATVAMRGPIAMLRPPPPTAQ
jgi:hypothetical protein